MSLNDCIQLHDTEYGLKLGPLTVEQVTASVLNRLEMYLDLFETSGMAAIEKEYYHYWIHTYVSAMYQSTCMWL